LHAATTCGSICGKAFVACFRCGVPTIIGRIQSTAIPRPILAPPATKPARARRRDPGAGVPGHSLSGRGLSGRRLNGLRQHNENTNQGQRYGGYAHEVTRMITPSYGGERSKPECNFGGAPVGEFLQPSLRVPVKQLFLAFI
jgi:hypothetical protein